MESQTADALDKDESTGATKESSDEADESCAEADSVIGNELALETRIGDPKKRCRTLRMLLKSSEAENSTIAERLASEYVHDLTSPKREK